jgi:hypothetical protein
MLDIPPKPPIRPVRLGPTDVTVEHRADGALLLRSPYPLGGYPDTLTRRLAFWAAAAPDRTLFAKRDPADPAGSRLANRVRTRRGGSARRCCGATCRRSGR